MIRTWIYTLLFITRGVIPCQAQQLQWHQVNGPFEGQVGSLAVHGGTLFAASAGIVFRSTNMGDSWTATSIGASDLTANGTSIFATTGLGVLRSTDDGATWQDVNNGLPHDGYTTRLAANTTTVFVGVDLAVYRSTDNGESWAMSAQEVSITGIESLYANGSTILAGSWSDQGSTNLMRSSDNGITWSRADSGVAQNVFGFAGTGDTLFAADGGVVRSINNGVTWERWGKYSQYAPVVSIAILDTLVFAGSSERNGIAGYGVGVLRCSRRGDSLVPANNGIIHQDINSLAVIGGTLITGTNGGLYRSVDRGQTWLPVNHGWAPSNITALCVGDSAVFAGTDAAGVYRSVDNGNAWTQPKNGISKGNVTRFFRHGPTVFAWLAYFGLYRTTDSGESWERIDNGLGNDAYNIDAMAAQNDSIFVATSTSGVLKSTDNGATWIHRDSGLAGRYVSSFAVVGDVIVAAAGRGGMFRSTDAGESWVRTEIGLTDSTVEIVTDCDSTLIASTRQSGFFRSLDKGLSWEPLPTRLADQSWTKALVANNTTIVAVVQKYTSSWDTLFVSTDNGDTWTPQINGLPSSLIYSVALNDELIYAGVSNGGVYRADLPPTSVSSGDMARPTALSFSIAPNPVQSKFSVLFNAAGTVDLELDDLLGRCLFRSHIPSGVETRVASFDVRAFPVGTYFMTVRNMTTSQSKVLSVFR